MEFLPRYSLIIPVYNNFATLPSTLSSVLRLEHTNELELVVSDDASTDGTQDFLRSWFRGHAKSFRRAKLLINENNVGISGNHARAFEAAAAEYGLYIGGDDLIENPRLFNEIETAIDLMSCTTIAKLDVEAFFPSSGRIERIYQYKTSFFRMSSARQFAALALYGNFLYAGPGTLIHIPTLRRIGGGFDIRFRTYEDLPLFMAFLSAGHRLRFVSVKGVIWVRAASSLSMRSFGGMRERFEQENGIIEDIVKANWGFLSCHERRLYKARRLPKFLRYLVFLNSLTWLRFRFIPSLARKARTISRRK